jgi:hypothetical protein
MTLFCPAFDVLVYQPPGDIGMRGTIGSSCNSMLCLDHHAVTTRRNPFPAIW